LVLDDHEHEYGIYKLDMDAADDGVGSDSARLLPHPSVIRIEVPMAVEGVAARFTALGSCIVTTGSSPNEFGLRPKLPSTAASPTSTTPTRRRSP
jgi:hypothetical protein